MLVKAVFTQIVGEEDGAPALGVAGCELTVVLELATDSHPAFVSVKVYVAPDARVTTPLPSIVGPLGVKV